MAAPAAAASAPADAPEPPPAEVIHLNGKLQAEALKKCASAKERAEPTCMHAEKKKRRPHAPDVHA